MIHILISIVVILIFFLNQYTKNIESYTEINDTKKDKAYVINLDSRPDRWLKMLEKFKNSSFTLERFSAIKHEHGLTGCGLSHASLIQMAKDNNMESILIIEDDSMPIEEFDIMWPKIKKWLDNNKDAWDIYVGGNSYYANKIPSLDKSVSSIKPICSLDPIIKLYYTKMLTTGFYYLNKSGYDKYLEWKNNKHEPIDIWPNIINMKILSSTPFIATQEEDFSNINNSNANYHSIFKTSENIIASIQNNSAC